MRIAAGSFVCTLLVYLLLLVRGASDWSSAFATLWYGLFGLGVILGLAGLVVAVAAPGVSVRARLGIAALSLPAPTAAVLFVWFVLTVIPQLAD
jgi:hypothetical protein